MTNRVLDISQVTASKYARVTYLGVVVFGILAQVLRVSLIEVDDATATMDNIKDSEFIFRLAFVSNIFMLLCFLMLGQFFYVMFNRVDKNYSYLLVLFVTVSIPLLMLNTLNHLAVLVLLGDADYLTTFSDAELSVWVMLFLDLYEAGYRIAQIFFGLWLLPLGYLATKSGYFPKIVGFLPLIGGTSLLIETFTFFLTPGFYETIELMILGLAGIGEVGFILWFVIIGPKLPKDDKLAS